MKDQYTTELDAVRAARNQVNQHWDTPAAPPQLSGYAFIREIHRGGQGIVYHALQESTGRPVAIKVLRYGRSSSPDERARLRREVTILGQLQHPCIVAILDSGVFDGSDYFVMDYIDGLPLDRFVNETGLRGRAAVPLCREIAAAVQSAHARGVIHRDLKPANVLVDREGRPRIVDFGLAKVDDSSSTGCLTVTGQVLGSLPWLAPEQARGAQTEVDVRTDIYAMGVSFWQVVTGAMPYRLEGGAPQILRAIAEIEPQLSPDSRTRPPRDVETILRKCLAKDPQRRYQSAAELVSDFDAYLDGRPITARRNNVTYVLTTLARRHRLLASLTLALVVLVLGSSVALTVLYRSASASRRVAEWNAYQSGLQAAVAGLMADDVRTARRGLELTPSALRGWEWRYLSRVVDESVLTIGPFDNITSGVAWNPQGTRFAVAVWGGPLHVYDLAGNLVFRCEGHSNLVFNVAWSPDGRWLASASSDRTVRLWDAATGAEARRWSVPQEANDVAFSPDSRRLAAAVAYGAPSLVWNVNSGEELLTLPAREPASICLTYSPNGALLARGSIEYGGGAGEAAVQVHDAETGEVVHEFAAGSYGVRGLAFSPDSRRLAAATSSDGPKVWDLDDPTAPPVRLIEIGRHHRQVAFTPDGDRVLTVGEDGLLYVSDSWSGARLDTFRGHEGMANRVAIDPSGRLVATTSSDRTMKLWDLSNHPGRRTLRGHRHGVSRLRFSPDGRYLFSSSGDADVRVWDTSTWACVEVLDIHKRLVEVLEYTVDQSWLITASHDGFTAEREGSICLWDEHLQPRQFVAELSGVNSLLVTPDSQMLVAMLDRDGETRAWDFETAEEIAPPALPRGVWTLAQSPSGRYVVGLASGAYVYMLDGVSWEVLAVLSTPQDLSESESIGGNDNSPNCVAFMPNESVVAVGARNGITSVWSTTDWELLAHIGAARDPIVGGLAFSPDASRLAIAHTGGVTLVDTHSWDPLLTLRDALDIYDVAFSPDGKTLAAASSDATVRIWSLD